MENHGTSIAKKPKSKWKIVGIIFIILTALALIAGGLSTWRYVEQKAELNDLRAKNEKIVQENKDTAGQEANTDPASPFGAPTAQEVLDAMGNPPHLTTDSIYTGDGKVVDSSIPPYQIFHTGVQLEVGGYAVVLFRVNDRSPWQFGWAGQGVSYCDEAASNFHLIRAFADVACFDRNDDPEPTTYRAYFEL